MPRVRLNLAALRGNRLPGSNGAERTPHLTRRELLGMAGTAAAIFSPPVRALSDSLKGSFTLKEERKRAAFQLGGEDRWVIDTAQFGGDPKLSIERADRAITVSITGATYPGTDLPADFTCELKQGLAGWKMKLKHSLGGFSGQASFERWLVGAS